MPGVKEEDEPQTKKVKREETEAANESEAKEVKRNNEGDAYFHLGSAKKRCTVKTWKKNVLVDIREVSKMICVDINGVSVSLHCQFNIFIAVL